MKLLTVVLVALSFITLSGSCRLEAAQAAPQNEEEAAEPEADPRFEGIPIQHHAYLATVAKKNSRLIESWLKTRALYDEAHHSATVFGLRVRKRARSKVPGLIAKARSSETKFRKAYDKFRSPIVKEEAKLKDRAMTLAEKPGAINDPVINKRADELYDQALVLGENLNALVELLKVFHHSTRMPSDLELLGIHTHDTTAFEVAKNNPKVVEARFVIMDCQADIAALEKLKAEIENDPKKRWSSGNAGQLKKANMTLEKAAAALAREAEKAKAPFLREAAKFEKKMAKTKEKIVDLQKRKRNSVTYFQRLSEQEGDMQRQLMNARLIDTLATWKKPEEKKAPAKKGGH